MTSYAAAVMAATLQSRVQLLAILAVAFILVSVPLFYQVRADAAESRETAKSTFLSKFFRQAVHDFKPPEDLQVEDAWEKWQQENPDCGSVCDPDADPDGDGVPNKEEVEKGRNPNCNEEKEGNEYCAGQPKTPPPKNETKALQETLFEATGLQAGSQRAFEVNDVSPNYDRWEIAWDVNNFVGYDNNYRIVIRDAANRDVCCGSDVVPSFSSSDFGSERLDGKDVPPSAAKYTVQVQSGGAVQGSWHILVKGIRAASSA